MGQQGAGSAAAVAAASPGRPRSSACCQPPIGASPARSQAAWPSTLYAGRGAGRARLMLFAGRTRAGSAPRSRKTSWASPNQVVSPLLVAW